MYLHDPAQRPTHQRLLTSLQQRLIKSGLEGFEDYEIIELLLSLGLSRRECKKLAKQAATQFESLGKILAASPQELQQAGIPPRCIFCIRLMQEIPARVLKEKILIKPVYQSPREIFDYLCYSMRDLKKEVFKVIYLNNRNQIIDTADLFEGTLESIPIRPREIVESAIKHGASALLFAHNHPSGDNTPSRSDKQLTRDLVFIGLILQIKVLDHIIIAGNTYFSFAEQELIRKYEDSFLNLKIRGVFDIGVRYLKELGKVSTPFR